MDDNLGDYKFEEDWWSPIDSAPEGVRVLLSFPPVYRPWKVGEPKPKGVEAKRRRESMGHDIVVRDPNVMVGILVDGEWKPGRSSPRPFYDPPSHWQELPGFPESYYL